MPIYNIEDSKFKVETISIVEDFSQELLGGDLITGIPTITVTLLTGIDPSPSLILFGGISILRGKAVEQRFRQGIPGCIYTIVYTVQTVQGFEYIRERILAVLPLAGSTNPQFNILTETSSLYPYELVEALKGTQELTSGRFTLSVVDFLDSLKGTQILSSGDLTPSIIYIVYNYVPESLKGTQILTSGSMPLTIVYVSYNLDHEDLKGTQILISGSMPLTIVYVTYSNDIESIQGTQILTGGSLA